MLTEWKEFLYHFLGVVAAILVGLGLIGCVVFVHQVLVAVFT